MFDFVLTRTAACTCGGDVQVGYRDHGGTRVPAARHTEAAARHRGTEPAGGWTEEEQGVVR